MKTFLVLMLLASPALAGGTEVRGRVTGLPVLNGWHPPVVAQQDNVRVQAKMAADGSFRFELEPGEWEIRFEWDVSSANTSLLTRARIRVDPGQPVPPVELGLLRGDASLDGRFVETYSYEWGVRLVSELPGGAEFETETGLGDGGFRFAGLAPGFYTLQVYAQHCNEEPRVIHEEPVWLPAERPVPVRLSGGDRLGQAVAAAPPRP